MLNRDEIEKKYVTLGKQIRDGLFTCVRQEYALTLAHSVRLAQCAGIDRITAIELGVAGGRSLLDLCNTAVRFTKFSGVKIDIVGFDIATGMPTAIDYRDHPEVWHTGQFDVHNETEELRKRLDGRAELIIGNVSETIPEFIAGFGDRVLGFIAVDLDQYSGTRDSLPLFEMPAENYLPAVPMYVDDINVGITYNPWCGEALAISEFNEKHSQRKIEEKHVLWGIQNFHVMHLFDHPMRCGEVKPPHPLDYGPF